MNAIFSRQSVRKFEERAVEEEKIEKILRAAMAAPSAKNQQPWEFFVLTSRRDGLIVPEFRDIDMAIATENILLEIEALGLGAVMIGVAPIPASMEKTAAILDLPDTLVPFTIVPFGYSAKRRAAQDRYDPTRVHWIRE